MTKSVYIVAVESSADHVGAGLIRNIKKKSSAIKLLGVGGPFMETEGVISRIDITGLAIVGFVEPLKSYPKIIISIKNTVNDILLTSPDVVVLIDSWGFMIRVAKKLKKSGYKGKIVKYIAPQVWAMRKKRSKVLSRYTDHLLSIHDFESHYFETYGLSVTYVGNPVFDTENIFQKKDIAYKNLGISPSDKVLAICFGSRSSEINNLIEPFIETVLKLIAIWPNLRVISPVSGAVIKDIELAKVYDKRLDNVTFVDEKFKESVFNISTAALACSGTVTTQLALAGVPTVVAYRLNPITFIIAKILYKPKYISLVNISAEEELMPEFLQKDVNSNTLSKAINLYIQNDRLREKVSQKIYHQITKMRPKGKLGNNLAAETILELIDN
jgi:lipid-A-disaccharide synthase